MAKTLVRIDFEGAEISRTRKCYRVRFDETNFEDVVYVNKDFAEELSGNLQADRNVIIYLLAKIEAARNIGVNVRRPHKIPNDVIEEVLEELFKNFTQEELIGLFNELCWHKFVHIFYSEFPSELIMEKYL